MTQGQVLTLEVQNRDLREAHANLEAENSYLKAQLETLQSSISHATALVKDGENERMKVLRLLNEAIIQKRRLAIELDKKEDSTRAPPSDIKYAEINSSESEDREIIPLVADLNEQILAVASDCAELVLSKGYAGILRSNATSERDTHLQKEVSSILGDQLFGALTKVNHYQNPTILRIAVQSALSNQLHEYFGLWPLPYSHAFSDDFWRLCDAIKASGKLPDNLLHYSGLIVRIF